MPGGCRDPPSRRGRSCRRSAPPRSGPATSARPRGRHRGAGGRSSRSPGGRRRGTTSSDGGRSPGPRVPTIAMNAFAWATRAGRRAPPAVGKRRNRKAPRTSPAAFSFGQSRGNTGSGPVPMYARMMAKSMGTWALARASPVAVSGELAVSMPRVTRAVAGAGGTVPAGRPRVPPVGVAVRASAARADRLQVRRVRGKNNRRRSMAPPGRGGGRAYPARAGGRQTRQGR